MVVSIWGFFSFLKTAIVLLGYVSNNSLFPEPLSKEEELEYINKMIEGNEGAKNVLIEKNLRLVAHISKKYANSNIDQEDIISVGTIGLIKGINSFNPNKCVKLSTYISRCIDNEILMFIRSRKKINSEIYLEEPVGKDKDNNVITLQETLVFEEKSIEEEVDFKFKMKKVIEKIKEVLEERERLIIVLRFGLNGDKPKTQKYIAQKLGISRSYVSRIETKALDKLAKEMKKI